MLLWPWTTSAALSETFLPTALQAEGLLAIFASGLVMVFLGRAILGPRVLPELALISGWGAFALVLTLWGVYTPLSMAIPAIGLIAVAAFAALTERGRLGEADLTAIGRLLVLALPLLAVMAASLPSGPDTFTNQLPNAAYLYDFHQFPGVGRPPMLAVWPAFPYNLQLAAFLPSLLVPAYPPNILTHTNLLLQLAFALLLARSMRGPQTLGDTAPSWAAIGAGILLTTFLNPGFAPAVQFSGYADPAVAVTVAFAAWQAERLLAALAGDRSVPEERLTLVLALLAGVAVKQVSIVLMAAIVAIAFLLGAFDRRIGPVKAFVSFATAFLPAVLLVSLWRFYIDTHFTPDDELRFLAFKDWGWGNLPAIASNMALRIWERAPFFMLLYGVALSAIPVLIRRGLTPGARLFAMTLGVTLLYTIFLVFSYVSHFPGDIGASAHSFFRYNTHLGLLATLAFVMFARESWVRRGAPELGGGWRGVAVTAILLAIITPVAAAGWIRGDRRQPQPLLWDLARWTAPQLDADDTVALILPDDNRSVAFMLRVAIAISPPYRPLANFIDTAGTDMPILDTLLKGGAEHALISCVTPAMAASPIGKSLKLVAGQAAMLVGDGKQWKLGGTYAYKRSAAPERWTTELSPGPFCR
jgi:hypothetical protein